jgi:hypothetical protein
MHECFGFGATNIATGYAGGQGLKGINAKFQLSLTFESCRFCVQPLRCLAFGACVGWPFRGRTLLQPKKTA